MDVNRTEVGKENYFLDEILKDPSISIPSLQWDLPYTIMIGEQRFYQKCISAVMIAVHDCSKIYKNKKNIQPSLSSLDVLRNVKL